MRKLQRIIEQLLWNSRLVMLVGALFSVLLALAAFYMATVDALLLPERLWMYSDLTLDVEARSELRARTLTGIIKAVDGYAITAILIIFSLGLYELFLGRLQAAERSPIGQRLLSTGGLEGLKERIAQLLMLVLVIEFFQRALRLDIEDAPGLLYMALGILAISVALAVGRLRHSGRE